VALKKAEELREAIEKHDFKGKKVTVSVGVSELRGSFLEAVKRADEAMYEAKKAGKNQVKGKR
jgi:diguanylate cyclase (GGDEF)-like protein